ncbi:two-component system sensor kinase [Escherichia coli]|uniref:Two-component system sensor kinase n=1 Tax=Escherichia coli TaxID=562 RepID=A0A2X1MYT3_ECOLX|nr:two-component system sensor kinase [Escherichia coli]
MISFLTDNPSNLTASGLLLSDDESGVREIGPGQLCVNFNMSNAMQEAVLQLIEVQLAQEEVTESPLGGDGKCATPCQRLLCALCRHSTG